MTSLQPNHGGGCCGAAHLWSFSSVANETSINQVKTQLRQNDVGDIDTLTRVKLIEVILTSEQLEVWRKPLEDLGFKVLDDFSWVNPNSGRTLFMLIRNKGTHTAMKLKKVEEENARLAAVEAERKAKLEAAKPVEPPVRKTPVRRALAQGVPRVAARRPRVSVKRDPA